MPLRFLWQVACLGADVGRRIVVWPVRTVFTSSFLLLLLGANYAVLVQGAPRSERYCQAVHLQYSTNWVVGAAMQQHIVRNMIS
jgi:hypothetical protein